MNSTNQNPGIWRITFALNASTDRKDLFQYLCKIYPEKAIYQKISEETGHSTTNLKGAAIGDENSFSPEDALVTLNLAEIKNARLNRRSIEFLGATGWGFGHKDQIEALCNQIIAKERGSRNAHINASPALRITETWE